ncbi:hypothetical protein AYO38_10415 [bacterium SCGC AG-212-C10]|nr:hypothetical protein AYO38_10415 [bacterium SCGC AG-212-C10]
MSNWYDVLEVSTSASQAAIDASYERLSSELRFRGQTPAVVEQREQVLRAHTILSDAELRAAYDRRLAAAPAPTEAGAPASDALVDVTATEVAAVDPPPVLTVTPESDMPSTTVEPVARVSEVKGGGGGPSRGLLIASFAFLVVALGALAAGGLYFLLRDDSDDDGSATVKNVTVAYPTDLADDAYDLAAMSLKAEDLPDGIEEAQSGDFNNEEWASVINSEDPEPEQSRLDSVGRVRNHLSFFSYEDPVQHLGRPYQFVSQSTLFKDEAAAIDSIRGLCDLPLTASDPRPHPDFDVPTIGQEAAGFSLSSQQDPLGEQIDTTICFRTGRIVHSVTQRGLDGTVDTELSVRLAQRMLQYVNASFTGTEPAPAPTATAVPTRRAAALP